MPANILRAFFVFFETKLLSGTPKFLKNLTGTISATYIPYLSHTHFLSVEKLRLLRLNVPFVSIYADTSAQDSWEYGIFSSLASSFCAAGSNATRKSQLYTCSWNSVLVFPYSFSVYVDVFGVFEKLERRRLVLEIVYYAEFVRFAEPVYEIHFFLRIDRQYCAVHRIVRLKLPSVVFAVICHIKAP